MARTAGEPSLSSAALAITPSCYRDVIAMGYEQNPDLHADPAGRRPKRTKAQNLLLRLVERESEVLRP